MPPRLRSWSTVSRSRRTEAGGPRGFDARQENQGPQRHVAVDMLGLPIECQITPGDTQDRDALAPVLREVRRKSPFVTMSFVDFRLQRRRGTARRLREASRISVTVVKRNDKQIKGFIVLPKRWVVERTFGWINRARRLAKDFEATMKFLARMAPHRPRLPAHATPRQGLRSRNVISSRALSALASQCARRSGSAMASMSST